MTGLSLAFAAFVMAAFVAGPASAETNKIRIGVQSVPPDEVYLAKAWYKPYGIEAEITQFASGGEMLKAFVAGRVDVANGGSARLFSLAAKQPHSFSILAARDRKCGV